MVFGYISAELDINNLNGRKLEVEVAKNKYEISVIYKPLHDPENNFTKF